MSISKKTLIIFGVAAAVVVILLGGIGIGVLVSSRSPSNSSSPGIFKRCDRSGEPMGEIKISSCPDSSSVGYCQIKSDEPTLLELTFSPGINYQDATLHVDGPLDDSAGDLRLCGFGIKCPGKKGATQTLVQIVPSETFKKGRSAKVTFSVFDAYSPGERVIFCVEFPARIV